MKVPPSLLVLLPTKKNKAEFAFKEKWTISVKSSEDISISEEVDQYHAGWKVWQGSGSWSSHSWICNFSSQLLNYFGNGSQPTFNQLTSRHAPTGSHPQKLMNSQGKTRPTYMERPKTSVWNIFHISHSKFHPIIGHLGMLLMYDCYVSYSKH